MYSYWNNFDSYRYSGVIEVLRSYPVEIVGTYTLIKVIYRDGVIVEGKNGN